MKGGLAAAAAAAVVGGANALSHHRHAHDLFAKRGTAEICVPSCTTIWTTIVGEPTLVPNPPPKAPATSSPPPVQTAETPKAPETPKQPETPETPEKPATPEKPEQPATSETPVKPATSETPETPETSEVPETPEAPKTETSAQSPPPPATTPAAPVPTPNIQTVPTPGTYTFPATTITIDVTTTVCGAETTKVPAGTHTVGGVTTVVETATTVTCPVAKVTTTNDVVTSIVEMTEYVCPTPGTYTIEPITTTVTQDTVLVYPVPTSYPPGTYTQGEQIVTVTETGFVYVCPFTSEGLPTTAPAPTAPATTEAPVPPPATTSAPAPVKETTEAPAPPKEETSAPAPPVEETTEAPAPTTEALAPTTQAPAPTTVKESTSAAPKSTTTPKKGGSGGGKLRGGNDHYGITYTPFDSQTGDCKSKSDVDTDIKGLKESGFSIVRVYSATDCHTLDYVGDACKKYGLEMILGIFVKETGCSYETEEVKEQVDALADFKNFDIVKLVVVGNEAIMNGFCTAKQLKELVTIVKTKCPGHSGGFTISETLNIWQQEEVASEICGVVDVTGANIHPYFNAEVVPSKAGEFVQGQLDLLQDICPGNEAINLECGWPTRGSCNGKACPGKSEQLEAITSIRETCGDRTVFFAWLDEMWKVAGDCGCEQSWGVSTCFT